MTEKDKSIIRWVEENKSMTIYQCSQIFYGENKYGYDQARKRLQKIYKEGFIKRYRQDPIHEAIYYIDKKLKLHDLKLLDVIAFLKEFSIHNINKERKIEINSQLSYVVDSTAVLTLNDKYIPLFIEIDYTHYTSTEKIENLIRYEEKKHKNVSYFFIIIKFSLEKITVKDFMHSKILWVPWNFQKDDKLTCSLRSLLYMKKS